jgi:queuine tRNA-ribosyltransferase
VTDDGVVFASHLDGQRVELTPEKVVEIQTALGSDIMMPLDECVKFPAEETEARVAVRRTVEWATRSKRHPRGEGQTLFGIVQGSTYGWLRRECARRLVEMDFPGYAIGGLSVGEGREACLEMLEVTVAELPADRPRYLMGVGPPLDMLEAVERGVDMFDCVLPTRNGRNGFAFTSKGVVRLRNAAHALSDERLDEECACYACRGFSRGYLRHLMSSGEMLGMNLVSLHNVAFFCGLMARAREAIREKRFVSFKREFLGTQS